MYCKYFNIIIWADYNLKHKYVLNYSLGIEIILISILTVNILKLDTL